MAQTADYHMKLRAGELVAEIAELRSANEALHAELEQLRAQTEQIASLQDRIAELTDQVAILRSVQTDPAATNVRSFIAGAN